MKLTATVRNPYARRFWDTVTVSGTAKCLLADEDCEGTVEAHHICTAQSIKRRYGGTCPECGRLSLLERAEDCRICGGAGTMPVEDFLSVLYDPANGVPLCPIHHSRVTTCLVKVPRNRLTKAAYDFADTWNLRMRGVEGV